LRPPAELLVTAQYGCTWGFLPFAVFTVGARYTWDVEFDPVIAGRLLEYGYVDLSSVCHSGFPGSQSLLGMMGFIPRRIHLLVQVMFKQHLMSSSTSKPYEA